MAAASYTTDLTLINAADAANANWTEPTGFVDGAITLPETDYFIQGTGCLSKNMGAGSTASSGAIFNSGAGQTIQTPNALYIWLYFGAPNALATEQNGGLRVFVGSAASAFRQWYVKGSDSYTYGGWICIPVDPNVLNDATTGAPTQTFQFFGAAAVLSGAGSVSKGNPFGIDVLRYGRGELRISNGDLANGYATFAGAASQNDSQANRWGIFQRIDGGFLMQGKLTLGFGSAVDFRDSNVSIQIANTKKVSTDFNAIEVQNATSRVDWTSVNISSLGTTSKGIFTSTAGATLNLDTCVFTDMSQFNFGANSTLSNCTFRRVPVVSVFGAAIFSSCTFDKANGGALSSALTLFTTTATISNCKFNSSGTGHAIRIDVPGTYDFRSNTFTGYAATNGVTGNETIYLNAVGTFTILVDSAISVRLGTGAIANVIVAQKALTVTGIVSGSDVVVLTAGTTTVLASNDGATNPVTSFVYNYQYAASTFVDIAVYKVGYVPLVIRNYLLQNANAALPVAQVVDRNYTP